MDLRGKGERQATQSRWFGAITLVLLAAWHLAIRPSDTGYRSDSILYLAGAESLAEEGRYVLTTHVNSPRIGLYPPLQSAYLAVAWACAPRFPDNVPLLQWSMILILLALAGGLFVLLRAHGTSPVLSALVTLLCGVSPLLVRLVYTFFSEPLFAALGVWMGVLWVKDVNGRAAIRYALTGIGLALMFLSRTAAIGFIVPLAAWLMVRILIGKVPVRRLVWAAPVLAAMVLWWLAPKETPDYTGLFKIAAAKPGYATFVVNQAVEYASGVITLVTVAPRFETFLAATIPRPLARGLMVITGIACMALVVWGFLRDHRLLKWPLALALLGYQVQLIFWPWPVGGRAQLPVLAFFLVWFLAGLSLLPARTGRIVRLLFLVFLILNLGINGATSWTEARALEREGDLDDLREMAMWARDHIPADRRIAAGLEQPLFHFVQLSGRRIAYFDSRLSLAERVSSADYVLLWGYGLSDRRLPEQSEGVLRICHESPNGHYQLVQVNRGLP